MYFTYREENRTFQDFGFGTSGGASVTGLGEPEQVRASDVTYGTLASPGRPACCSGAGSPRPTTRPARPKP